MKIFFVFLLSLPSFFHNPLPSNTRLTRTTFHLLFHHTHAFRQEHTALLPTFAQDFTGVAPYSFKTLAKREWTTHIHVSVNHLQLSTSFQEEHTCAEMEMDSSSSRDPKSIVAQTSVHTVCLAYCLLFTFVTLLLLLPTLS